MFEKITEEQHKLLRHSLGLDRRKEPYRNYYAAPKDSDKCAELVEIGLMWKSVTREGPYIYFHVTKLGMEIALKDYNKIGELQLCNK